MVIFGREFQVPLLLTLERLFAQYTEAVNELVSFESKMAARTCEKIARELRFCHVPYLTTIVHEKGQNMASSKCLYYEILNFSSIVRPRFSKQFSVMFLKHHKIDLGRCKLQIEQGCLFHAQMILVLYIYARLTSQLKGKFKRNNEQA